MNEDRGRGDDLDCAAFSGAVISKVFMASPSTVSIAVPTDLP
jgi:hypothetical protein